MHPHQLPLGVFVKWIQGHPPSRVRQGSGIIALRHQALGQLPQRARELHAQTLSQIALPVVKVGGIGKGETGEEVVTVQGYSLSQGLQAASTNLIAGMPVRAALRQQAFELLDIHPQVVAAAQRYSLSVDQQPFFAERGMQDRERSS
jgi:hypothetical protein